MSKSLLKKYPELAKMPEIKLSNLLLLDKLHNPKKYHEEIKIDKNIWVIDEEINLKKTTS